MTDEFQIPPSQQEIPPPVPPVSTPQTARALDLFATYYLSRYMATYIIPTRFISD